MNIKRMLCAVLALVLAMLCACGKGSDGIDNTSSATVSGDTANIESLSLLYSMSDSLNPYKSETRLNRQVASLMFDPLVRLDNAFQPQYILAQSIEFNGKVCTVTLKSAVFSDGSAVTADDVVYSMKQALESELTIYKAQLASVKSVKSEGSDTVSITMTKSDPYFANLLDFPIIKSGSDGRKDENNIPLPPIGSGRYIYNTEDKALKANAMCVTGCPSAAVINLINAPDDEVVKYNLEVGNVGIYYTDLSDGVIPPMAGTASAVNLNNLIYLGVRLSDKNLRKAELRYAIAAAIDREAVCNDTYYSYATPASGLFSSVWEDAGSLQNLSRTADLQNVVANLKEIGYNSKNDKGYFTDTDGRPLSFKLIAFNGNERRLRTAELIAAQLESAGFKINLVTLDWEKYVAALSAGDFDLYLAEVKLLNNMDVTELVTSNGTLGYGIPAPAPAEAGNGTAPDGDGDSSEPDDDGGNADAPVSYVPLLDSAVSGFYNESLSLVDIINAFNAEMPLIPVCHRTGLTVCSSTLGVTDMSSVSDVFFGITDINILK